MRKQHGPHGQWASLYGTSTLRLEPWFSCPSDSPRYELLVMDDTGDVIVPLDEWYRLMRGYGAQRTRDTYCGSPPALGQVVATTIGPPLVECGELEPV